MREAIFCRRLLRAKVQVDHFGRNFEVELEIFTPIIRTPRLPANNLILHGHGVRRMDILPKIKLLSQS